MELSIGSKRKKMKCCLLDFAVGPPLLGPSQIDVLLGPAGPQE